MNAVLSEDLEYVASYGLPWQEMNNSTVLVTGASGLVGTAIIESLKYAREKHNLNLQIIEYMREIFGDIRNPIQISEDVDYIFHCASITKSADMVKNPLDVISVSIDGTRNVLDFAERKRCKSVVYLSSMEVYGVSDKAVVSEADLGYIDLSNPRSCYPESKRMSELFCNLYCSQYNVPVKIARLAQTFGAGTPKTDARVFAQFAHSAINGDDIILHTEGKSRGNYCYIADTITALLTILLKGDNGQAYNVSADSATIREMAELVANEYGINIVVDIPKNMADLGYAPTVGFKLNTDTIQRLGWKPKYRLLAMYKRMVENWQKN